MSRMVLSSGLLLALGVGQFSAAQESSSKPDTPTPKATQSVPALPKKSSATAWEKRAPEPQTVADLPALAASVAAYISSVAAGCQQKLCTVLITNFTLADGDTSAYGIRLADLLSRELTNQACKVRVIDRERLQNLLAEYRIPARSINHAVVRWIADELGAEFIVFGTTELDNGVVLLSSHLIDTTFRDWNGQSLFVNLRPEEAERNLEPVEPFPPLPGITSSSSGEAIYKAGADGTGLPHCTYMPNPPYSEGARKLNLSGPVTADAVINSQGTLENVRIVSGLPGGLNEQTVATLKTWRCQPALRGDKAVPTLVPFTVQFRAY